MTAPRRPPSTRSRAWQLCLAFLDNLAPQKWQVCRELCAREPATIRSHPDHFITATAFDAHPRSWKAAWMKARRRESYNNPERRSHLFRLDAKRTESGKCHCLVYFWSQTSLPPGSTGWSPFNLCWIGSDIYVGHLARPQISAGNEVVAMMGEEFWLWAVVVNARAFIESEPSVSVDTPPAPKIRVLARCICA